MKLLFILSALIALNFSVTHGRDPRIIGGVPASIHDYSFAAAIEITTATGRFFCGGTLYKNQYIITAGQCVKDALVFTISLGTANRTDPNRLQLASSEYFLHPDFDSLTLDNDIGIIKLRQPIQFTDSIKSIDYLAQDPLPQSRRVRAIGWGQTNDADAALSPVLQSVYVIPLSNKECADIYGNQITDNMVCVDGNYNEGACHGDTGSPLVDIFSRYHKVLAGISSFVSGNGCESTDPSGYTRVYNYVSWIESIVS